MTTSATPLRVLQVIPSFGLGGAEQMAGHLMMGLADSLEVSGASLSAATDSVIEQKLRKRNIRLWHLGKRPGFDPRMYTRLDRVLAEVRPDVVHTHMSVLRYVLPAVLLRRIPAVVHTLHSLAEHETDAFGRLLNRLAFRRSVMAVSISQQVAVSFRRLYGMPSAALVPNGIPVDDYCNRRYDRERWRDREGFDRDALLFTSVGRLEKEKNPLLTVAAFAHLNHPQAHLVLLGSGSLRDPLSEYVRNHGLQDRVHLLGRRNEVAQCLAASDVFVLGSNWEGNPLAVMEAMAAGLPVVSTAVGGVPELVESGRSGILVPQADEAALTAAMARLSAYPDERRAMGYYAQTRAVASFGLEHMARGYVQVYRTGLSSRPAARYTCAGRNFEVNS
jgi:glycosyltransferase involved in cell wall biosynthesis